MAVDLALVQNLGRDLAHRVADLTHGLGDEEVAALLAEDPDVAAQRTALEADLARLAAARETLDAFLAGDESGDL